MAYVDFIDHRRKFVPISSCVAPEITTGVHCWVIK